MSEQIKPPVSWDCSYALPLPSGQSCGGSVTTGQVENIVADHNASAGAHLHIVRRTLAGNIVLTSADASQQKIIPDADRNVTLPAEDTGQWLFELCHGGAAYALTVRRAGGAAVAVLIPGSPVVVSWDGVAFGIC